MVYDAAGNLTTDTYQGGVGGGTGGGTRTYDAENRMTQAQFVSGQSQTATYTYDADGRRIKRNMGAGGEVWQVYGMGGELLAEYAPNASPTQPQKEYGYRSGELLVTASSGTQSSAAINVAAASNGATANASSTISTSYPASSAINGDRKGLNWNSGGGWNDATANAYPDWLEVSFSGSKTINEINVFTLQDNPTSPSEPTETMAFTLYGATAFDVQYWDGTQWLTVPGGSVTGNNLVWRKLTFAPVTTTKIRVVVNNALASYSRIVEIEALQVRSNVALSSNGATATASSTINANYPAASTINGDRKGLNWNAGGGWNDGTANAYPDWVQVDFSGSKTIDEIDVFTLQDNPASPSEPTETMAFTLYGITSFDVQYWNGSSWATVQGGSVSGNNKVWRKLTFTPVTTTKIRVVVNAALASHSRIVEVEAFETAAGGGEVQWLVTDQLGTPRMVIDKTGSLAGVKRHDYFAFGEEVAGDASGRTTARGYVADTVRQKFTGYERDTETSLDYAQARYFASAQGRFTGVDPLMASGIASNPQSWNRYAYALNNPLRLTDPTGMVPQNPVNVGGIGIRPPASEAQGTITEGDEDILRILAKNEITGSDVTEEHWIASGTRERSWWEGPIKTTVWVTRDGQTDIRYSNAGGIDMMPGQFLDIGISQATGGLVARGARAIGGGIFSRAVSTEANGAVFSTGGKAAQDAATTFALDAGKTTLNMTSGGRFLTKLDGLMPEWMAQRLSEPMWNNASRVFSRGASGEVNVFTGGTIRTNSIWLKTEVPTLLRNPNVTTGVVHRVP